MARYIFRGGRQVIIDPEAHRDVVDLTPAELISQALDMAETESTRGFKNRSALLIELAYRLEGMPFPDDDPDVEQKLEFEGD